MIDAHTLIEKHRSKGVLVDTSRLGQLAAHCRFQTDSEFYGRRFRAFAAYRLVRQVDYNAPVLGQVSDLTDLPGKDLNAVRKIFGSLVEQMDESYDAGQNPYYSRSFLAPWAD